MERAAAIITPYTNDDQHHVQHSGSNGEHCGQDLGMATTSEVQVFKEGVLLSELNLPVGYWYVGDEKQRAYVVGQDSVAVFNAAWDNGIGTEHYCLDMVVENSSAGNIGAAGIFTR